MDKSEQSPLHKPHKDIGRIEQVSRCSPNQSYNGESTETKEYSKYSNFLYGEQFCNYELHSQSKRKRQCEEDIGESNDGANHDKKSKLSVSPHSADDGSNSTCFDEDRDLSNLTIPNRKHFSSQINSPMAMSRDTPLQYLNYPSVPFLRSPEFKGRVDYNHYPLHSHHIREDACTKDFFSSIQPPGIFPYLCDDGESRNDGLGSELHIAAYNNFVRKVVDETLDRTITFCEQPRNAISALERICSKAWPQLEAKRHRNRIRAYLKACRRNSKKNRGQINMKEPPMNALSVEARQIVTSAMNLVRKDIEQLREDLKRDSSPPAFAAKNGTLPINFHCPETFNNNSSHHRKISTISTNSSLHSNAKPSIFTEDHYALPKLSALQSVIPPIPSLSKPSTERSIPNTPNLLDVQYFSALMRFLPTSLQFNKELGVNLCSSEKNGASVEAWNDYRENNYNKNEGKILGQRGSSLQSQPPPAAHFSIARCSPSLSRATSMLLEVRPLSQASIQLDDLEYFQRYQGLMEEAIEYVRGVSQMLMKKVEIIEGHIKESKLSCRINPLNCATN
ncbi:unnamed protein product [Rodentolepis nana]|uniref:Nucleolar protein 4 helical domain-containing protein n=1 Tax=Rodentolepis nana TaxID=102285 RepID=A0A0R3T4Q5_RODNA|nr:unnamed protein product [Rodentolepis nana]